MHVVTALERACASLLHMLMMATHVSTIHLLCRAMHV